MGPPRAAAGRRVPSRLRPDRIARIYSRTMTTDPSERPTVAEESAEAARSAGLRYVSDTAPGIRRIRAGQGFRYLASDGSAIDDPAQLERIRALAIPPAWTEVWIAPSPRGHIQAVGRDARHRKQYRYHATWREVRDATKYEQLIAFGEGLPALRRRVERDLRRPGMPREKVLATVVRLLETTLIRVGNEEYARANQSFGLTTMRDRHVDVAGARLEFRFRGKSGKSHVVRLNDRRLARIVKTCQDIPGYELFQYLDAEGQPQSIDSADVNAYLREIAGAECTAKLFRTWAGTVLALTALRELEPADSPTVTQRELMGVVKQVAARLGNTAAICRRCYIHPAVIESYQTGALRPSLEVLAGKGATRPTRLSAAERLTLAFLRRARRRGKR
jgi:DNA topoisomerase-1